MNDENTAFLMTADSAIIADMVGEMLNDNGIPSLRKYHGAGLHFKLVLGNTGFGINIYVPFKALKKAKELIAVMFDNEIN